MDSVPDYIVVDIDGVEFVLDKEDAQEFMKEKNIKAPNNKDVLTASDLPVGEKQPDEKKDRPNNLYVKHLDDSIDNEDLFKMFSKFGDIISLAVMKKDGRSKGYGFVQFETREAATTAIAMMNRSFVMSKPLYVAWAERAEERKAQNAAKFQNRAAMAPRQQPMGVCFMPPPPLVFFPPHAPYMHPPSPGYMPPPPVTSCPFPDLCPMPHPPPGIMDPVWTPGPVMGPGIFPIPMPINGMQRVDAPILRARLMQDPSAGESHRYNST